MKIQIERKEIKIEVVDVEFPIYSYLEEGDAFVYTKLTKEEFKQIRVERNEIIVTKFKRISNSISEIWFDNQCDEKKFKEGVKVLKKYANSF